MIPIQTCFAGSIFDQLLMPGEVISAHAKWEKKCEHCHEKLEKANQNQLCLNCHEHKNILQDISNHQGYHGRLKNARNTPCKHCHTDHRGRDAKVVPLDTESFDHSLTDFQLRGLHGRLSCAGCHKAGEKYSAAPLACIRCHEKDDPHLTRLGEECERCHVERGWQKQDFNHDTDTEYKLAGKHSDVACKLCHAGEVYKKTPKECHACHRINDFHGGRYGDKCNTCHFPDDWKETQFDHARDTKFPLREKHRKEGCNACHSGILYGQKLAIDCASCHKHDDVHKGRNGPQCDSCHAENGWGEVAFSHDRDTQFNLKGKHKKLACEACHIAPAKDSKLNPDCFTCHRADDVHKGQLGEACVRCHKATGWGHDIFFQHDLTSFPLIGQHNVVACEQCHLSSAFKDVASGCRECHGQVDVHEGGLGDKCANCHNPNGWGNWLFDHDAQTEYRLDGAHEGLTCNACHNQRIEGEIKLENRCIACHRREDKHQGSFGTLCQRCHITESFSVIEMRH